MSKKIIAFCISLCMLLALVAGCVPNATTTANGSTSGTTKADSSTTTSTTGAATTTSAAESPTIIKAMVNEHVQSPMSMDIATFAAMGKALNITIEFEIVPNAEYNQKADLVLASKEYPDFMRSGTNFQQYCAAGVFVDLTQYMDNKLVNYYNIFANAGTTVLKNIKDDQGKYWAIYKFEGSPYQDVYYINQDWLDDLNLGLPKTIDELTDTLYKFQTLHPDGIAWGQGPWMGLANTFYGVFGTGSSWYQPEEGSFVFGPVDKADQLKERLTWMNKLYKDKIIDPDFLTRDSDAGAALIASGKSGFQVNYGDNATLWGKGGTEGVNFTSIGIILKDDTTPVVSSYSGASLAYYIPTGATAPLDKILEMFNYIYSEDGINLFAYGIEGETYTMTNGKPVFTDTILKNELGAVNGRRQLGINPNPFPHVSLKQAWLDIGAIGDVAAYAAVEPYLTPAYPNLAPTTDESTATATIETDINKLVSDSLVKFIVGELNLTTDWDAFQKSILDMGFAQLKEVKQAQYSRWNNR